MYIYIYTHMKCNYIQGVLWFVDIDRNKYMEKSEKNLIRICWENRILNINGAPVAWRCLKLLHRACNVYWKSWNNIFLE